MSTKTSIKRIALVAVASLGLGILSFVPANAGEAATSDIDGVTLAGTGNTYLTGNVVTLNVGLDAAAAFSDDDDVTVKGMITSQPGSSSIAVTATRAAATLTTDGTAETCAIGPTTATAATPGSLTVTCAATVGNELDAAQTIGSFKFTPASAGSYTFVAWHDADADGLITAGEDSATSTIVITNDGIGLTSFDLSTSVTDNTHTPVTGVTLTVSQNSARVGTKASITPAVAIKTYVDAGIDSRTFKANVSYSLTKPTGSAATLSAISAVKVGATASLADSGTETITFADVTFTPDVAGTYTLAAWHDRDSDGIIDTGEASVEKSIVVAADAIALTVTKYNSSAATGDWDTNIRGSLVKLTLTNNSVAASLASTEKITVSVDSGSIELKHTSSASTSELSATSIELTRDDFDAKGRVWLTFSRGTDGTQVVTLDGVGGGVDSLLQTTSITYKTAAGVLDSVVLKNTTGVKENTALEIDNGAGGAEPNGAYDVDILKSTSVSNTVSLTAADAVAALHVKDVSGFLTGLANLEYSTYFTGATTAAGTVDISLPAFGADALMVANTSNFEYSFGGTLANDVVVVKVQNADDAAANTVIDQNATVRAKIGSTITLSAVIKDQFGIARANEAVSIAVTNRNAHVVTVNAVSDANGRVSITYTDAPLAGVTATSDTVTFNQANGTDKTVTVQWVADLGVSKVTVTGGNTAAGVEATTISNKAIDAGADGASTTTQKFTAKVTDKDGSILVGVPVTWTVSGTGAAITSTTATTYSDSTGVATAYVYGWITGKYTVTATATGASGTGTVNFAQETATSARTVSATVEGSIVTALVKDRYGNPVKGVRVYATKTGVGYFGNGLSSTDGLTDASGKIEFNVTGGVATVTVSAVNPADPAGTTYGQTCAAKGNADCATTPTALTAYVAGTTAKDETGVGASYDAAGISSATVEVTVTTSSDAIDAANEATDAANAATDAANAAAEAADAATAAAQDAQAAVAELATKVASLIAGIKAQITTLTNLVIKIQKKVKA